MKNPMSELLQALRGEQSLTESARMVGVSARKLAAFEAGEAIPDADMAHRLLSGYGMNRRERYRLMLMLEVEALGVDKPAVRDRVVDFLFGDHGVWGYYVAGDYHSAAVEPQATPTVTHPA